VRNLAVARGSIEVERLKRLRKLIRLVEESKVHERGSVLAALRGTVLGGRKEDADVGASEPALPPESTPAPPESRMIDSDTLVSLYLEYCQSIPKLASLSPKSPSSSSAAQDEQEPTIDQEQEQEQAEYVMSRQQLQLTVDEGKVWDDLVADKPKPRLRTSAFPAEPKKEMKPMAKPFPLRIDIAQATLVSLAEKSSLISESYERRNNPPTAQTFEESKEIIRALGVPCLDSVGAYEAEALAASLVINGHADYVASEDTVC
jgi:flap endonuclease-1